MTAQDRQRELCWFLRRKLETDKEAVIILGERDRQREGRAQLLCEREKIEIRKTRRCTSVKGEEKRLAGTTEAGKEKELK